MNSRKDEQGNIILVESTTKKISIFLRLADEKHRRLIGVIDIQHLTLHIERDREKHLLNKANAYGFNYFILDQAKRFNYVCLHESNGNVYLLDREKMIEDGKFLFFKQQGFEKQIFLSIDYLSQFKVTTENKINLLKQRNALQ
jgi:hypothetical protein